MRVRFLFLMFILASSGFMQHAGAAYKLVVKPSDLGSNGAVPTGNHLVIYDPAVDESNLLLFLTGTGGDAENGPQEFYQTAVEQGYRLIALSYRDTPAVAQVCTIERGDPLCAENFRIKRIFGIDKTSVIQDSPADAILNRLVEVLKYLDRSYPNHGWGRYFLGGKLRWENIAVSGQSQGGGMAEFIGKKFNVVKVISFSGGWDNAGRPNTVAGWYSWLSATPPEAWYGAYHVMEPQANTLKQTYQALRIPSSHIFALNQPVPHGRKAHPQGVKDPTYRPVWIQMLGSGVSKQKVARPQLRK